MIQIAKNRYLDAFLKLLLVSAFIHLAILIVYAFVSHDLAYLNYFRIISLDLFFPRVRSFGSTNVIVLLATLGFYLAIFFLFTKRKK